MPYREKYAADPGRRRQYQLEVNLWLGLLKGGETKTFTFEATVSQKGNYKFICEADALAQWGETEESWTLNVNE